MHLRVHRTADTAVTAADAAAVAALTLTCTALSASFSVARVAASALHVWGLAPILLEHRQLLLHCPRLEQLRQRHLHRRNRRRHRQVHALVQLYVRGRAPVLLEQWGWS